jgi:hypothetical protein
MQKAECAMLNAECSTNGMRDYRKYNVWHIGHEFALYVYKEIIPFFPKSEQFDLASQLKRSAYSVPMNVAEGCGRNSDKDFVHFLDMALGSLMRQNIVRCWPRRWDLLQNINTTHLF